ncbi:hypothetical protein [Streptomyces sp. NPDC001774]
MQRAIDFIKDNPEVFAAVVAAIGILGGIAGNWISAALQAAGGKAQANAAVDAARISAEAQRLAALREDRKAQLAGFIRCARKVAEDLNQLFDTHYRQFPVSEHYDELGQMWDQIELVAPENIRNLAAEVVEKAFDNRQMAVTRTLGRRVRERLAEAADRPEDGMETATAARLSLLRLGELYVASRTPGDGDQEEAMRTSARNELSQIPWLTEDERDLLLEDAMVPTLRPRASIDDMGTSVQRLLEEARRMLGADAE